MTAAANLSVLADADPDDMDTSLRGVWAFIDIVLFIAITGGNLLTITAVLRRYFCCWLKSIKKIDTLYFFVDHSSFPIYLYFR